MSMMSSCKDRFLGILCTIITFLSTTPIIFYMTVQEKNRALFTLSETQKAINSLKKTVGVEFVRPIEILKNREGKIITCGVGKSSFVAMKMAATLTSIGHPAVFIHPTDALHGDVGIIAELDVLICYSFSGESEELIRLVKHVRSAFKIKVISFTGDSKSRLAKLSDSVIKIKIHKEGSPLSLAPMASISASLVASDMLASAITDQNLLSEHSFVKFHPNGSLGLKLKKVSDFMEKGKQLSLIKDDSTLKKAVVSITNKGRGVVGIVNSKGSIVGVITDGDIRRFIMKHVSLKNIMARDIMTKKPKTIGPEQSLQSALNTMSRLKITNLFVVNKKNIPVGMIHIHNIVENVLISL